MGRVHVECVHIQYDICANDFLSEMLPRPSFLPSRARPPFTFGTVAARTAQYVTTASEEEIQQGLMSFLWGTGYSGIIDLLQAIGGDDKKVRELLAGLLAGLALKLHKNADDEAVPMLVRPIILDIVANFLDGQASLQQADHNNRGKSKEGNLLSSFIQKIRSAKEGVLELITNYVKGRLHRLFTSMSNALRKDCKEARRMMIREQNEEKTKREDERRERYEMERDKVMGASASSIIRWAAFSLYQRLSKGSCAYGFTSTIDDTILTSAATDAQGGVASTALSFLMEFLENDLQKGPRPSDLTLDHMSPTDGSSVLYQAIHDAIVKDDIKAARMYLEADAFVMKEQLFQKQMRAHPNATKEQEMGFRQQAEAQVSDWYEAEQSEKKLKIAFQGQRELLLVLWRAIYHAIDALNERSITTK